MLPFLAILNGYEALLPHYNDGAGVLPADVLRAILIAAPTLRCIRGRRQALELALPLIAGQSVVIDEQPAGGKSFHIVINLPEGAKRLAAPIDSMVRLLRPAHITHTLNFGNLSGEELLRPTSQASFHINYSSP